VLSALHRLGAQNAPSILNRVQGAPTPVEESTSNTDTGVTVTLATAEWLGLDPKGSKWYLVCEDHGELLSGTNRATLKSHMRSPSQWCETCRETKTSMRRKAQADTDGVMIALRPPDHILEAVQVEGGEPFDQLHVTVIYLGGTDEVDKDALVDAVMVWADVTGSMPAQLSGYGMFENDRVLYAAVDVVGLDRARTELIDALGIFGIEVTERHGMQPHLTLMYGADEIPDEMPSAAMEEFTFTEAILAYGGDWMTFPLLGEPEIRAEAQKKTGSLYSSLMSLRSAFIEAAQMEYDAWNQEGPGYGICDEIAARMSSIIAERIPGVEVLDGGHDGDDHAWLLVVDHNEEVAYGVDISQDHYETGGGYSWTKKPGVRFSVDMVDIWEADYELMRDNREFDDFYSYGELKKSPEPALPEVTGEEDDTIKTEIPEFEPEPEVDEFVEDVPKPGDPRLAWLMNGVSKKGGDDMDIAGAARAFLNKSALKDFSPAEQRELIEEGEAEGVVASNLDRLDIAGTHYEALEAAYEALEAARQSEDDEELWLL